MVLVLLIPDFSDGGLNQGVIALILLGIGNIAIRIIKSNVFDDLLLSCLDSSKVLSKLKIILPHHRVGLALRVILVTVWVLDRSS